MCGPVHSSHADHGAHASPLTHCISIIRSSSSSSSAITIIINIHHQQQQRHQQLTTQVFSIAPKRKSSCCRKHGSSAVVTGATRLRKELRTCADAPGARWDDDASGFKPRRGRSKSQPWLPNYTRSFQAPNLCQADAEHSKGLLESLLTITPDIAIEQGKAGPGSRHTRIIGQRAAMVGFRNLSNLKIPRSRMTPRVSASNAKLQCPALQTPKATQWGHGQLPASAHATQPPARKSATAARSSPHTHQQYVV